MRKFKEGQKVYWNDPAGETSGEYEVHNANEEKYADLTDEDVEDFDERIILIGDGFSEAEVFAAELEIINPMSTEEMEELNNAASHISSLREELLQKMREIVSRCDEQQIGGKNRRSFKVCDEDYHSCTLQAFIINDGELMAELYYDSTLQKCLIPVRELDVFTMFEIICQILK